MLKTGKRGEVYTVGYDGKTQGPTYADEGSTVFGAVSSETEKLRETMAAQEKKMLEARAAEARRFQAQQSIRSAELRAKQAAIELAIKKRAEAIQRGKDLARVKASYQPSMGYDFKESYGNPLSGFGCECEPVSGMDLVGELSRSRVSSGDQFSNTVLQGDPWGASGIACAKEGSYENPYTAEGDDVADLIQDAGFDSDGDSNEPEDSDSGDDDTADMETPAKFSHPLSQVASPKKPPVKAETAKAQTVNYEHPLLALMRKL